MNICLYTEMKIVISSQRLYLLYSTVTTAYDYVLNRKNCNYEHIFFIFTLHV